MDMKKDAEYYRQYRLRKKMGDGTATVVANTGIENPNPTNERSPIPKDLSDPFRGYPAAETVKEALADGRPHRCMASYCDSFEVDSYEVGGCRVWLCKKHKVAA